MKVQIQTTQNVDIEYDIASIGSRIGARLIDNLILVGYVVAIALLITALGASNLSNLGDVGVATIIVIVAIPWLCYHPLCEIFLDGQSFGKKAVKIRVVKMDGSQPSVGNYIVRWLIGLFEMSIMGGAIALIAILANGKGQRLGDMAAGTTVVKLRNDITLDQTIYAAVQEDYTPTFPTVTRLSDDDVAVIQEVLNSEEQITNPVVIGTLVRKIESVLGITSELPPTKLLRTVVKDYNYYTSGM